MKMNKEKGGDDGGGEEEESTDQKAPVAKKLVVGKRVTTFARALASSRKKVRDLALEALQVWLNKHDNLSDVEMQKLWKALFYYIWMADKETEIEKVNCCTISSGHVWKTENAESRTRETGHRQGCWVIRYSRNAVYSGIV
mmetsp:Transcript_31037/g.119145  ORF Transcript_31037/g.119145 Transcript_31037/m.119145 type:complete len:141 (-) Transcript_31037:3886-4308(-)